MSSLSSTNFRIFNVFEFDLSKKFIYKCLYPFCNFSFVEIDFIIRLRFLGCNTISLSNIGIY